jgi:CheY-like chemotaxis protein
MAKVLVIEDSMLSRGFIRKFLAEDNHEIVEAVDGRQGLEALNTEKPDLVILDLLMPIMDGFAVLETMKKLKIDIPVVVMTADIQTHVKERCLLLGAKAVLNKPPKKDAFIAQIAEILGR